MQYNTIIKRDHLCIAVMVVKIYDEKNNNPKMNIHEVTKINDN